MVLGVLNPLLFSMIEPERTLVWLAKQDKPVLKTCCRHIQKMSCELIKHTLLNHSTRRQKSPVPLLIGGMAQRREGTREGTQGHGT